ncbi:MAG: CoA transferase [Fusobacteriaceae bacterium]|jgi:crotonobetainyl-CoA:carnitine CoA-transferase CaiB-like acyl-CoA transferase|nr:CoA transferase [Fusobacteriaceae bacterium]
MNALEDLTVIDLTRFAAGPFCTLQLADLGAKVIKVESKDSADEARNFTPFLGEGDERISGYFVQYNRNKKGITLNLRSDEGKKLLLRMLEKADVLVENYRPGVMKKMGLDFETLHKIYPKLIFVSISGYGQTGPYIDRPAFDNCAQALSGIWSTTGYPDRPPCRVGTIIGDLAASLYGCIGVLAALHHVKNTGEGQYVDVSQLDSTLSLTEMMVVNYLVAGKITRPLGNDHPFVMPYSAFKAKDGYIFDGGYTDKFWRLQCEFFGEPELADDPEIDTMVKRHVRSTYERRVKPKLDEWIAQYTIAELMEGLGDKIPMAPILDVTGVVKDPQILSRNMIIEKDYPQGKVSGVGQPIKLSQTPADTSGSAPAVGEHNREIYLDWLGLSKEDLQSFEERGVI